MKLRRKLPSAAAKTDERLVVRLVRAYLRSGWRGHRRVTFYLARRLSALQAVPVQIAGGTLYVDLRLGGSHALLKGSPWPVAPAEAGEQRLMRRVVRRGDIAFDIGANIGLHTLLLSELVAPEGRVFAFEPNPELRPTLSLSVSAMANAQLLPVALSDRRGNSTLFIPDDHTMSSLADWTRDRLPGESHQVTCEQQRLDDLVAAGLVPQPDFVKCDVEGAELLVFRGGRKMLDRADAPVILFEVNAHTARGFNLETAAAMNFLAGLKSPRYRFFKLQDGEQLAEISAPDGVHANVLAVPRARSDRAALPL